MQIKITKVTNGFILEEVEEKRTYVFDGLAELIRFIADKFDADFRINIDWDL